jgi:hypothetical protein
MTVLERWDEPARSRYIFRANGCLDTHITAAEVRSCAAAAALTAERVAPLIWLAMPGHEYDVSTTSYSSMVLR